MRGLIRLAVLAAFAPGPGQADVLACHLNASCEVRGRLHIQYNGPELSDASIQRSDGTCVPVALPLEILKRWRKWRDRPVVVAGDTLARVGRNPPIVSTEYRDRWIVDGMCSADEPILLYARQVHVVQPTGF
jgi:hypothetical protein